MMDFSKIEKYLPQYLSTDARENLFSELDNFPKNIDGRIYTNYLRDNEIVYQGDGFSGMLSINLPDETIGNAPAMVLSNTCDVDTSNERLLESRIVYATIFRLDKYENLLIEKFVKTKRKPEVAITNHIELIKKQYISHIFYLPASGKLEHNSIVVFDRTNNISNSSLERDQIPKKRLFTLSDYGFYLLLYKLSIHFTRIRENLSRSGPPVEQAQSS